MKPAGALVLLALAAGLQAEDAGDPVSVRVDTLVRALGNPEPGRREAARLGLLAIGSPAVPVLKEALRSDDPEVRASARKLLDQMRIPSGEFDARIRNLIDDLKKARDIREATRTWHVLAEIGWEATKAVEEAFPSAPVSPEEARLSLARLRFIEKSRPILEVTLENTGEKPVWIFVGGFSVRSVRRDDLPVRRAEKLATVGSSGEYGLLYLASGDALTIPFYASPSVNALWKTDSGGEARVEIRYHPCPDGRERVVCQAKGMLPAPSATPLEPVAWKECLRGEDWTREVQRGVMKVPVPDKSDTIRGEKDGLLLVRYRKIDLSPEELEFVLREFPLKPLKGESRDVPDGSACLVLTLASDERIRIHYNETFVCVERGSKQTCHRMTEPLLDKLLRLHEREAAEEKE